MSSSFETKPNIPQNSLATLPADPIRFPRIPPIPQKQFEDCQGQRLQNAMELFAFVIPHPTGLMHWLAPT